jgi:hypothetical protein
VVSRQSVTKGQSIVAHPATKARRSHARTPAATKREPDRLTSDDRHRDGRDEHHQRPIASDSERSAGNDPRRARHQRAAQGGALEKGEHSHDRAQHRPRKAYRRVG